MFLSSHVAEVPGGNMQDTENPTTRQPKFYVINMPSGHVVGHAIALGSRQYCGLIAIPEGVDEFAP